MKRTRGGALLTITLGAMMAFGTITVSAQGYTRAPLPRTTRWVAIPPLAGGGYVTTNEGGDMSHCSYHAEGVGYDTDTNRIFFTARVSDALLQQHALLRYINPYYQPQLRFSVASFYHDDTRFDGTVVLDAQPAGHSQLSMAIPLAEPTDASRFDPFGGVSWFPVREILRTPGAPPANTFVVQPGDNWYCAIVITHHR